MRKKDQDPLISIINEEYDPKYPIDQLKLYPGNARQGASELIESSIQANGFYGCLLVQKETGYILKGNNTYEAALSLGYKELPVLFVDVDEERALSILLADNKTTDHATYSKSALLVLVSEALRREIDPRATLHGPDDRAKLLEEIAKSRAPIKPPSRPRYQTRIYECRCGECGHVWMGSPDEESIILDLGEQT